jgi:hypothetical protein
MKNTMTLGSLTLLFALGSLGARIPGCGSESDDGTGGAAASSSSSVAASSSSASGANPTPPPLTLESLVNAGSGCPAAGAVSVAVDPATGTLVLTYPPAALAHPPGPGFQKINCATGLVVHGVPGWRLAATSLHAEGHAHLPATASGQQRATISFAGSPASLKANNPIEGAFDSDYTFSGLDGGGAPLTSGCGEDAILNVDVSLILQAPASEQENASIDLKKVAIAVGWQGC